MCLRTRSSRFQLSGPNFQAVYGIWLQLNPDLHIMVVNIVLKFQSPLQVIMVLCRSEIQNGRQRRSKLL